MKIPTLTTGRLQLRLPDADCEGMYQRFYTDADASRAYGGPLSPAAALARLSSDLGSWQLHGFGVWAIRRRKEGDFIGVCGFWQGKDWPRELTWWLVPEARGRGFAHEASLAAVAHAYAAFGWESVETYMNDSNDPARALVLRLGGVKTDRRLFPDNLERDVYRVPAPTAASGSQPK
ncbi:GNAT family N-acetyltransferase [Roseateles toxinivorans]|uniref:GNAT family N-acetyltransferase n=1 Tax=Roseateles toxinivorans TaxID=270368 RepID=UPI001FB6D793|nr:GNAT family N-acetyltransferase [Roseateles toxinivorans]